MTDAATQLKQNDQAMNFKVVNDDGDACMSTRSSLRTSEAKPRLHITCKKSDSDIKPSVNVGKTQLSWGDFARPKLIGQGAYGKVFRAYHKRKGANKHSIFAVKQSTRSLVSIHSLK